MPELNPHFPKPKHVIVREKTIPPNFTASFIDKRIHECQSSGRFRELLTEMLSTEAQILRYFVGGRQPKIHNTWKFMAQYLVKLSYLPSSGR